ncbi:MAG: TetR/AcrR family transcriptional regulator [Candidatus Puniceispirillaceae bacterium]
MNAKDTLIAKAGLAQFARYGWRKMTMQDVADAAGISRQTLYNRVSHKEELLRLVVHYYLTDNIERCRIATDQATTIEAATDALIAHFLTEAWQTLQAMPETENIEMASNAIISQEVANATKLKTALISDVIARLTKAKNANEMADFFYASLTGIKSFAKTQDQLDQLSAILKQSLTDLTK